MLPPQNFYWFRIDTKHMTEPWLDQALMAYRTVPCDFVTHLICMKNTKVSMFIICFSIFGAWRPAYEPGKSTVPLHEPAVQFSVQHAAVHVRKLVDSTFQRFLFFFKIFFFIFLLYRPYFIIMIYHTPIGMLNIKSPELLSDSFAIGTIFRLNVSWTGNFWMVDIGINAWSTLFLNLEIKKCLFSSCY